MSAKLAGSMFFIITEKNFTTYYFYTNNIIEKPLQMLTPKREHNFCQSKLDVTYLILHTNSAFENTIKNKIIDTMNMQ